MREDELQAAITELMPQLTSHLERTLSVHVKARYPVEDIVQDTYVRALENLTSLEQRNTATLMVWLQRIAHRLVIDKVRQKESQQVNGQEASALYSALTSSRQLTPSRECSRDEAIQALETALADLPEEHRLVLKLHYVEQLSFAQIAIRLDRTAGAIRGLHRNALQGLRRTMGGSALFFFR